MPQSIQLTPEQVPQFLEQTKKELAALQTVIDQKIQILTLLDEMKASVADTVTHSLGMSQVCKALHCLADIQIIEYRLQVQGLLEKKTQGEAIIKQLENQSLVAPAHMMPPKMPPFGGKRN